MRKVQVMGVGILAALALVNMTGHAYAMPLPESQVSTAGTPDEQTVADVVADAALQASPQAPRAFVECVSGVGSQDVYLVGTFVGRECTAPDGERWFAGLVWHTFEDGSASIDLMTGP